MSGIGKNNIVKVKTNKYHQLDPIDLERAINDCLKNNEYPLIVIPTLGTTVFGAIDPINDIADICKHYNIWCHLDAALGGTLMFSK